MRDFIVYLFWPNPGASSYDNPKVMIMIGVCLVLVIGAAVLSFLRRRWHNTRLRKLSASWATASCWFGIAGLLLTIARVEQIQFVAMRFLWVVWCIAAAFYIWLQIKSFSSRYYEVLPRDQSNDPRSKYLPHRKKR